MSNDLEERYQAALEFVKGATERYYVEGGRLSFPEEDPFSDVLRLHFGNFFVPDEIGGDFEISEEAANFLLNNCEKEY